MTQTNKKWSLCTHPAVGRGKGTWHSTGRDNHNTNTPHALHLFASAWPPFNGIGVIVNLKHKERLKAILSGTVRKEREVRKEEVRQRTTVRKGSHNTKGARMLQFRLTPPSAHAARSV